MQRRPTLARGSQQCPCGSARETAPELPFALQDLAIGLWNSMLCTAGRDTQCGRPFVPSLSPYCPTPSDRFYTGPDVELRELS